MRTSNHIWDRRLDLAKRKLGFCMNDRELARHWPTCAVGEGMERLASYESQKAFASNRARFFARYKGLYSLGFEFHHLVDEDKPYVAEITFARIERYIMANPFNWQADPENR